MKRLFAFLVICAVFMAVVLTPHKESPVTFTQIQAPLPSATPSPLVFQKALDSDKLWSLIQEWRVKNNLQPYVKDQRLCQIAIDRADDGLDDHKGLFDKYSNYPFVISENDTYGAPTEYGALYENGWLSSPPHKAALEKPWKYSCVACHNNDCSQIFSNLQP